MLKRAMGSLTVIVIAVSVRIRAVRMFCGLA